MARKISTEKCIACGACAGTCPVDCITEGGKSYTIDAEKCIDCGACEGECPTEAISEA